MSVDPRGDALDFLALRGLEDAADAQSQAHWPEAADGIRLVVVIPRGMSLDTTFIRAAADLVQGDPRVATVSLADDVVASLAQVSRPLPGPGLPVAAGWSPAAQPAGSLIAVNARILDLVGDPLGPEGALTPDSLRAWAVRANHRGLRHLWWTTGGSFAAPDPVWPAAPMDVRESAEPLTPLSLLVERYRATHAPLRIGVEASWLQAHETGAQVATVHWVSALARRTDIDDILLMNLPQGQLPHYARHLAELPRVGVLPPGEEPAQTPDVYWRPYQPDPSTALSSDRRNGRRLVTTILDLIEFTNERYHGGEAAWYTRRRQFRRYARQVDALTGISDDVVNHLLVEIPGLDPDRLSTTALGVEHLEVARAGTAEAPGDVAELAVPGARPFLLVLGNDFMHKNRDFAVRVWQEVVRDIGVDLVLAGLHVAASSTGQLEAQLLAGPAPARGRVVRYEHVSPDAKVWLLANAAAVLYPTSAEGFGFVPHEAALLGSPTVYTAFGPLGEFLPAEDACQGWDVQAYSQRVRAILSDPGIRLGMTRSIAYQGAGLTWDVAGDALVGAFRRALQLPPQPWGLWERTEAVEDATEAADTSQPVPPEQLGRALDRATYGRNWRVRKAARRARSAAGKVKRRTMIAWETRRQG